MSRIRKADPNDEEPKPDKDFLDYLLTGLGAVAVVVLIATWYRANVLAKYPDQDQNPLFWGLGTGQFGDAFGFATSIFTGSAFLGLLITMRMQRKEIQEIRKERKIAQDTFDANLLHAATVEKKLNQKHDEDRAHKLIEEIRNRRESLETPVARTRHRLTRSSPRHTSSPPPETVFVPKPALALAQDYVAVASEILGEHVDEGTLLQKIRLFRDNSELKVLFNSLACAEFSVALETIARLEVGRDMLSILNSAINEEYLAIYLVYVLSDLSHDAQRGEMGALLLEDVNHVDTPIRDGYIRAMIAIGT
jgi:glutaredoxin-related protein